MASVKRRVVGAFGAIALTIVVGVTTELIGPPRVPMEAVRSDNALLARAWGMPVASTFRPAFVSQSNGSRCERGLQRIE